MDSLKRQHQQASVGPCPPFCGTGKSHVIPFPSHVRSFAAASASNRKTGKKHPGKAILAGMKSQFHRATIVQCINFS